MSFFYSRFALPLSLFVSSTNIFSRCFSLLRFPLITSVVTRWSSTSPLITKAKKFPCLAFTFFITIINERFVVSAFHNIISFISLRATRFLALSARITFLVSFVPVLKLSRLTFIQEEVFNIAFICSSSHMKRGVFICYCRFHSLLFFFFLRDSWFQFCCAIAWYKSTHVFELILLLELFPVIKMCFHSSFNYSRRIQIASVAPFSYVKQDYSAAISGFILLLIDIMMILKSILVIWLLRLIVLCNSRAVALGFFIRLGYV